MKYLAKTSTALALGLFGTGAFAQSNVTLYGVVDVPIEFVSHQAIGAPTVNTTTGAITSQPGGNRVGLQTIGGMSGPRWGIRGVEDLGSGLQSLFVLESGFGVDTGTSQQGGRLFGRQAFVGLRSASLGTVTFGRQYTSMFDTFVNYVPMNFAPLYEPLAAQAGVNFREDNMLKYVGAFGGLTAEAHWSFGAGTSTLGVVPLAGAGAGETPGAFRDNTAYGAGLSWSSGTYGIAVGYDQWNPAITVGSPTSLKKASIAANYTVGPLKLMAGYRWGHNQDATGSTLLRDDYYWVGANYQATSALSFSLGYYYDDQKSFKVSPTAPAVNPANPWMISFLSDYSFSKRTDLYLIVGYVKNAGLNFDTAVTGFSNGYYLAQGQTSQVGAAIGVRHKF
nr:porin [uncultured Cupriavidus sp.]